MTTMVITQPTRQHVQQLHHAHQPSSSHVTVVLPVPSSSAACIAEVSHAGEQSSVQIDLHVAVPQTVVIQPPFMKAEEEPPNEMVNARFLLLNLESLLNVNNGCLK